MPSGYHVAIGIEDGNKEILDRSPGKLCEEIKLGINEKMLLTRAERELGGWEED